MIKIQNANEIESSFFESSNFFESSKTVQKIISDVKLRGDAALKEYSKNFDAVEISSFEIKRDDILYCAEKLKKEKPKVYDALLYSFDLALRFAKKQKECFTNFEEELVPGIFTGQKNIPVKRAGLYIPAGRYPLLSTVVMTSAPAIAAEVEDIILCTPPKNGKIFANEEILAAACICGVKRIFAVGGAQAIAAMAFGTQSIPSCDVIAGPGNRFVAEAKKTVYGRVGIDMLAGPTEVFIIADSKANEKLIAADMLAQAEHDVLAQSVLATPSLELAKKVLKEIEKQLENLPTSNIAKESIENCGKIIITESLEEAALLANKKAPEHLELAIEDENILNKIASLIHNYGSLFMGHMAAEVFGDYASGLNHTLPTSGSARFTGGLSVRSFLKTVTTLRVEKESVGFRKSGEASILLAEAEGLIAHKRSVLSRME